MFQTNSEKNQFLLLDLLDFLVDKGNINIWSSLSSKNIYSPFLKFLKITNKNIQDKILGLIQKWGLKFQQLKELDNFYMIYCKCIEKNIKFPEVFKSNYERYISNSNKYNNNNNKFDEINNKDETFDYIDNLKKVLQIQNFEKNYKRLVDFLNETIIIIKLINLIIDKNETICLIEDVEKLKLRKQNLNITISGENLKNEKLMEISLGVLDDVNRTLKRCEGKNKGRMPKDFKSYFTMNNIVALKIIIIILKI